MLVFTLVKLLMLSACSLLKIVFFAMLFVFSFFLFPANDMECMGSIFKFYWNCLDNLKHMYRNLYFSNY